MKTPSNFFLLIFVLLALNSQGQKTNGSVAVNAGVGMSFFGILGSLNFSIKDNFDVESHATPVYVGSIDRGFDNHISIGIGGGYQKVDQTISNFEYVNDTGATQIGEFSYSLTKMNFGARILVHFGNGNIDAYMGVKPGVIIYQLDANENIVYPSWLHLSGSRFAFQVIPIGLRAYMSDNLGIFFETGIGAPSFISGGICVGFQSPAVPINPVN
jgi:hypothetical protein